MKKFSILSNCDSDVYADSFLPEKPLPYIPDDSLDTMYAKK